MQANICCMLSSKVHFCCLLLLLLFLLLHVALSLPWWKVREQADSVTQACMHESAPLIQSLPGATNAVGGAWGVHCVKGRCG